MPRPLCVGPEPLRRSDRLGRPPPVGGPASAAWEALACPEPIQGYASVWVYPGAPVLSVLRQSDRRVRPPPGPPRCPTITAPAWELPPRPAPRLPTQAHASGWIARAAGALLCLHTTDGTTAPARGVEAGGAIIASRPAHRAVLPRGQLEGCHAMGHPADSSPPSLGAHAVRSHCRTINRSGVSRRLANCRAACRV